MLEAWKEFCRGKRNKPDVQEFQADLMAQVLALHTELKHKTYRHAGYKHFKISDPKPRDIHKASVRDRLVHHALYRRLYPFFEKKFIHDSYSCRLEKGTHRALERFRKFGYIVSKNNTRTCFVLKCDVRKFFASIDRAVLLSVLSKHISDQEVLWLLRQVVGSFSPGLPLGNLTSQLLVNVYMDEFDRFVKHTVKAKYYIRYADDFVLFSRDKIELESTLRYVVVYLDERLKLQLHPDKIWIKTLASGIDFLGWVHFPDHRVLRTATKRRMMRRLRERKGSEGEEATRQSYLGMLGHGNTKKLASEVL